MSPLVDVTDVTWRELPTLVRSIKTVPEPIVATPAQVKRWIGSGEDLPPWIDTCEMSEVGYD